MAWLLIIVALLSTLSLFLITNWVLVVVMMVMNDCVVDVFFLRNLHVHIDIDIDLILIFLFTEVILVLLAVCHRMVFKHMCKLTLGSLYALSAWDRAF